jgi:hypothetical protein
MPSRVVDAVRVQAGAEACIRVAGLASDEQERRLRPLLLIVAIDKAVSIKAAIRLWRCMSEPPCATTSRRTTHLR